MTEWVVNPVDRRWLYWEEQLAPNAWLLCFKPNSTQNGRYWVNVVDSQWSKKPGEEFTDPELFVHCGDDALMQLCLMAEMRKRFGEPPWVQSSQS